MFVLYKYTYICMYVFFLFIICPCIFKYYDYTLIVYGSMCVTCFFFGPVVPPPRFFLPFQKSRFSSWAADMEKLTWKKSGIR